jgi:hypothetical protein
MLGDDYGGRTSNYEHRYEYRCDLHGIHVPPRSEQILDAAEDRVMTPAHLRVGLRQHPGLPDPILNPDVPCSRQQVRIATKISTHASTDRKDALPLDVPMPRCRTNTKRQYAQIIRSFNYTNAVRV